MKNGLKSQQNSNGISTLSSCYQVNLVIDIPNVNENYSTSHFFTCHHWVSEMFIEMWVTSEHIEIDQIISFRKMLEAKQNLLGKTWYEIGLTILV